MIDVAVNQRSLGVGLRRTAVVVTPSELEFLGKDQFQIHPGEGVDKRVFDGRPDGACGHLRRGGLGVHLRGPRSGTGREGTHFASLAVPDPHRRQECARGASRVTTRRADSCDAAGFLLATTRPSDPRQTYAPVPDRVGTPSSSAHRLIGSSAFGRASCCRQGCDAVNALCVITPLVGVSRIGRECTGTVVRLPASRRRA